MNDDKQEQFTKREIEVLCLMAQGKSNQEISKSLFVSKHCVDFHIRNIFSKLGVNNRIVAVVTAIKKKIINI